MSRSSKIEYYQEIYALNHRLKEVRLVYLCEEDPDHPELTCVINSGGFRSTSLNEVNAHVLHGFKPGDIIEVIVRKVDNDSGISKST